RDCTRGSRCNHQARPVLRILRWRGAARDCFSCGGARTPNRLKFMLSSFGGGALQVPLPGLKILSRSKVLPSAVVDGRASGLVGGHRSAWTAGCSIAMDITGRARAVSTPGDGKFQKPGSSEAGV